MELVSLLVNHSISLEERAKVYSVCVCVVRPALLYAVETWTQMERLEGQLSSCDHRILRFIHVKSKMAGQDY